MAIKRAFDEHFAAYGLSLPVECLATATGEFEQNGWDVRYVYIVADGTEVLECFTVHRRTNDRLYQIHADGRVEMIDSSTDGIVKDHDRQFYDDVRRRGHM